jgi:hypothetical protein
VVVAGFAASLIVKRLKPLTFATCEVLASRVAAGSGQWRRKTWKATAVGPRQSGIASWLGRTALSVGILGLSSIGLSTARQVSIAGMTQPISAQAIGPPGPTHLEVVMRMLLKAVLDTEAANEVFRSGAAAEALDRIQEALQPEALYGFVEDGERAFFAVFDLADPSEIPVISEPLFQRANVKITLTPCMTLEDVKKGIAGSGPPDG